MLRERSYLAPTHMVPAGRLRRAAASRRGCSRRVDGRVDRGRPARRRCRRVHGRREADAGQRGIDVVQVDGLIDPPNGGADPRRDRERQRRGATHARHQVRLRRRGRRRRAGARPGDPALEGPGRGLGRTVGCEGQGCGRAPGRGLGHRVRVARLDIGPAIPVRLDDPDVPGRAAVDGTARPPRPPSTGAAPPVPAASPTNRSRPRPRRGRAVDGVRPTLGDFIVTLDGKTIAHRGRRVKLSTAKVIGKGGTAAASPTRTSSPQARSRRAGEHTLTSPSIAYFLLVVGLALIVFEFFTISVGLAGGAGAIALIGAFVGFSHLRSRGGRSVCSCWRVFGLRSTCRPDGLGAWTVIATVALVVGSLFLYGGSSELESRLVGARARAAESSSCSS